MRLYHGTNFTNLERILKSGGLCPRGDDGKHNWEHNDMPSNPNAVYLTAAYAPYFAFCSCKEDEDKMVIIEVETDLLDPSLFSPDEDLLEQATRKGDMEEATKLALDPRYVPKGHPEWARLGSDVQSNMRKRTEKYREVMLTEYGEKWANSIEWLGNCAYHGRIPLKAITRYAVYTPCDEHNSTLEITATLLEPTICLANYRHCGWFYRALIAWFFGADLDYYTMRQLGSDDPEGLVALRQQDMAMYIHNAKVMFQKDYTEADYEAMVQETTENLKAHKGLAIYERGSFNKFRLVYQNGHKADMVAA